MAVPLFVPLYCTKKIKQRKLIDKLSDFEIRQQCGVPSYAVRDIINLYEPLDGQTCSAIPLETKVLVFLNHLRSGSSQWLVGSAGGISQPSVSRIINACCDHTIKFAPSVIDFPSTLDKLNHVKQKYNQIAGLDSIIGAVDGTHVPIIAPKENEYTYVNRKLIHSINCQVVADPHYRIFDIVAKWPGSTHDSYMWKNSSVRRRLNCGEFGNSFFIADSGYAAEPKLLIPKRTVRTSLDEEFNKNLAKTRCVVERDIGNWKSRFRSMHKTGGILCYTPEKTCKLIVASVALHNIFTTREVPILEEDQHYRDNHVIPDLQD